MSTQMYEVYFSGGNVSLTTQPSNSILLYPNRPTWNDFGFQVRALMRIKPSDDRQPLSLESYVLTLGSDAERSIQGSFSTWIKTLPTSPISSALHTAPSSTRHQFFSLLGDDVAYRTLASWAQNLTERLAVLLAINDLNLARVHQTSTLDEVERVVATDAFTLGVMRSSAAYRAYNKGARYITREELLPILEDAREGFKAETKLNGFDAVHRLNVRFGHQKNLVSDRAHVLIGKNGTGKTQLLNQILGSLGRQADKSGDDVFTDVSNKTYDPEAVKGLPIPNGILLFSSDLGDIYPRTTRLDTPLDYSYISLASVPSHTIGQVKNNLGNVIRDLIRDDSVLVSKTRFDILCEVLNPVLPTSQVHLPIRRKSSRILGAVIDSSGNKWLALNRVPGAEQQRLYLAADIDDQRDVGLVDENGNEYPPSSGQRVYLRFASQALGVISQGSMLLLDEPETHLHPNFVSEFMTLLHQVLEATKSVAIIATHSPYVVREVPGSCVHVVHRRGNSPEITGVHLRTLGASVSSISDAVFGDATARKFHALIAKEIAKRAKGKGGSNEERLSWIWETYGHELNTEMLSSVRFLMTQPEENKELS